MGRIIDVPFPAIPPDISKEQVAEIADEYMERLLSFKPDYVLCQGEFTLCYEVIRRLKQHNIICLAACSKRMVTDISDGTSNMKITEFKFVRFREY